MFFWGKIPRRRPLKRSKCELLMRFLEVSFDISLSCLDLLSSLRVLLHLRRYSTFKTIPKHLLRRCFNRFGPLSIELSFYITDGTDGIFRRFSCQRRVCPFLHLLRREADDQRRVSRHPPMGQAVRGVKRKRLMEGGVEGVPRCPSCFIGVSWWPV